MLKPADPVAKHAEVALGYGAFINTVIQFLIIAAAVFLIVKLVSQVQRKAEASPTPAPPTTSETLLKEIRDLLATRR